MVDENSTPNSESPVTEPETQPGQQPEAATQPTFTQDDLDRIAGKTRAEAKESARKSMLEEIGLDSFDELKAFVESAKERADAEKTEAQKLEERLLKEQARAQELETQMNGLIEAQKKAAQKSVLSAAITQSGGQDIKELFILIDATKADAIAALFDDNNETSDSKMDAFVKQLQADYPRYFATAGAGSPSNAGGIAPSGKLLGREESKMAIRKKHGI